MTLEVVGPSNQNTIETVAPDQLKGRLHFTGEDANVRIGRIDESGPLNMTAGSGSGINIGDGVKFGVLTIEIGNGGRLDVGANCRFGGDVTLTIPDQGILFISEGCSFGLTSNIIPDACWVARMPARITISNADPATMQPPEFFSVEAGARLTGRICYETKDYWLVEHAEVDGVKVPAHLRFVFKQHWQALPRDAEAPAFDEVQLCGGLWQFTEDGKAPGDSPLIFERSGRLGGYKPVGMTRWLLRGNELQFLDAQGQPKWRFHRTGGEGAQNCISGVSTTGLSCTLRTWEVATHSPAKAVAGDDTPGDDRVKLVIWDLDDTFWRGTLAEGGITPVSAHIELIKTLSERGIVNSICSKNHFEITKQTLIELGVWEYFIFPRIAFEPKGAMIQDIIQTAQLRAPSVLFIDDNSINLNEALHYNPGLQTCLPDMIPHLLDDRRCKGKPDAQFKRLTQYKLLETKVADRQAGNSDNLEFLRQSGIRISFHHDVEAEFARIHDLVNRTNQLNFTKNRWPEDEAQAREAFNAELQSNFFSHCGYVKVADRYGSYGICGFYLVRSQKCMHFLFSCRSLNMGIEQFVWHKIGRPSLKVVGEVVAQIGELPDWISVVDDADAAQATSSAPKPLICVRGACDLSSMTHYLRMHYDVLEEFTFPYEGWGIHPVARTIPLAQQVATDAGAALIARLPGMPPNRFDSAVNSGAADAYVLSFSSEMSCGQYRSRSTGMVLPLNHPALHGTSFTTTSYEALKEKYNVTFSKAQWEFMQQELIFLPQGWRECFASDVREIFNKLRGKIVIVVMLNSRVGRARWLLGKFAEINEIVQPLVAEFGYDIVDLGDLVTGEGDLNTPSDGGVHFSRAVYTRLAGRVSSIIARRGVQEASDAAFEMEAV